MSKVKTEDKALGCSECGFVVTKEVWVMDDKLGFIQQKLCSLRCAVRWHQRNNKSVDQAIESWNSKNE